LTSSPHLKAGDSPGHPEGFLLRWVLRPQRTLVRSHAPSTGITAATGIMLGHMAYGPTRAKRIATGLCIDCGRVLGDDGTTLVCRPCAHDKSVRSSAGKTARRARWKLDDSACNTCGASLASDNFKTCGDCRARGREARRSPEGLVRDRATRIEWQAKRVEAGLCAVCTAERIGESRYCRIHWLANNIGKYGFTRNQYDAMWARLEAQGFLCHYTGVVLVPGVNASLDHLTPRSRGGDSTDPDNCVWCDRLVNAFKNDLTEGEFIERCQAVVDRCAR
jgi:hypothetical protein